MITVLLVVISLGKLGYETKDSEFWRQDWTTWTTPKWNFPERKMPEIQIPKRQWPQWAWDDENMPVLPLPKTFPEDSTPPEYVPLDPDTGRYRVPIIDPGMYSVSNVDRKKLVEQEKALVEKRFAKTDTLYLETPYGQIMLRKADFWLAMREYKGENIVNGSILLGTNTLMEEGWSEYMKFISSSVMFANKLVSQMSLDGLSKEKKVQAILLCMQQKEKTMRYKYDLNPDNLRDTICYMRKPVVSIVDGLMNGYVGDCEDFGTDFQTLCLAAGIPEEDLVVFHTPGHFFVGIRNYSAYEVDDPFVYIAPDGSMITPIEPTISARMQIESCASADGQGIQRDTSYVRAQTIGYPNHTQVTMWSKQYPTGVRVKPTVRR